MHEQKDIIDCYDKTAKNYAAQFKDELAHKHLDQILLKAFALENMDKGTMIDLGCGPGQTTTFLANYGLTAIVGVDISSQMVSVAKQLHPLLDFELANMLDLSYPDRFFGSAIAFYSIVHFDYEQVKTAFTEIKRVLISNGQLLFTFHVGTSITHLDYFLEHQVNIDFFFFETHRILNLLKDVGFEIIDCIERDPYPAIDYASRRAYIWAKNS